MINKVTFSKDILVDLYLNRKLPMAAVAQHLGFSSHVTILNYLRKYNIPRRTKLGNRKPVSISRKVLFDLYHSQKLSQKQIAQKFGHSLFGIQRWMKIYQIKSRTYSEANTKYPKFNFKGTLLEKAYLIGFRLGDLNVSKVHSLLQIRCSTTIKEQINLMLDLFGNYGHLQIWRAKRSTLEAVILLNKSFNFLLPKRDLIEGWILADNWYFLSFLAGYADAEGSYYIRKPYYKKATKPSWGIFEIQSYDKNIILTIYQRLLTLGIECALSINDKRTVYKKDMCRITIVKKQSLWNFIKLTEPYHRHGKKLQELQLVKDNLIMRNYLPFCRPITL